MATVKLMSGGRIVIPKDIQEVLHLCAGQVVEVTLEAGGVIRVDTGSALRRQVQSLKGIKIENVRAKHSRRNMRS